MLHTHHTAHTVAHVYYKHSIDVAIITNDKDAYQEVIYSNVVCKDVLFIIIEHLFYGVQYASLF